MHNQKLTRSRRYNTSSYSNARPMTNKYPTLPQRLLDAVDRIGSPRAQMHRVNGKWESISAQEMLRRVAGLSAALASIGISAGDRVGICAPNCPEWHVADFAIL